MRWHRHGLTAVGGVAALAIGRAMLLEMQARRSFRYQHGGRHAALALANHERFKLRMDALEQREWREL
jgi:ribulose-5-phosphate 4-epimerase/fuculose-1-phosphate aldolase